MAAAPVLLRLLAGCDVAVGPANVGPWDDGVAVGPGYYYDEGYVDGGGYPTTRAITGIAMTMAGATATASPTA